MLTAALLGALILQDPATPAAAQDPKKTKAEQQQQKDIDYDTQLGKKYVIEVEKQEKLSDNKEYIARVERIGGELAAIAQTHKVDVLWGDKRLNKYNYVFKVLKGDDVNAFSLPGGFIYVMEGLVKYAESDDEIAAVLAHEISHAEERHIATLSHEQQKITNPGLLAIVIAILTKSPQAIEATILLSNMTVASFTSTWSVRAEQAADHGGFQYLTYSKYNPTAMLTFMERLALDEHNDPARKIDWGIYKTHPVGRDRAEAALKDMRTYGVKVQRSAVTSRFRTEIKPGKDNGVEIWFNKRKLYTFGGPDAIERADKAAAKLNEFFDQEPNLFDVAFDGKEILGKRSRLIEVLPVDARIENKPSTDAAGSAALNAIRASLYNYAFNIWGTR
jgi:beta-barrel assembly-enhancing protease